MPERCPREDCLIPEELMLSRLTQSDQMREFFIQMWLQNPLLARRAGRRMREMLAPVVQVETATR
jgi:hypothetical protein